MSLARPAVRKRHRRTEIRLALQMVALTTLVCAIAGWLAWQQVRVTLEEGLRDDLRQMRESADREIEALRDRVAHDLAEAETSLEGDSIAMEAILLGRGDRREAAARHRGTLDYFEVLEASGTVLASLHEPERIKMQPQRLYGAPAGRPILLPNADPAAPLIMAGGREFPYATRQLRIRGGIALSSQLLDRVARNDRALLVRAAGDAVVLPSTSAADLVSIVPTWTSLERVPGGAPGVEAPPDQRWLVDVVALPDESAEHVGSQEGDNRLAYLVYAVDRSRVTNHLAEMSRSFVALGSIVGVLAALIGVAIARGVARPVDDVVQAFDAIAEGRADYTFDVGSGDAMRELPAAFSRTHRALELQRRRSAAAERVAAWREVAQHLAHEVKNPLVPIRLTVENLTLARRQAPERFTRMFEDGMRTILEEVQQLSRIVSEFTEFARLPLPAPRPTDLAPLIERAVELHAAEPGLRIERRIDPQTPAVSIDPDLVSRALKNVVANAVDAVLEGSARTGLEPKIEIAVRPVEGMAEIEVADNGPGLSDESARHIFEPYFTTKPDGTGLGMTLTYRIIVDHGGTIVAENRHEGGARVLIRLPCERQPAGAAGRASEVRA